MVSEKQIEAALEVYIEGFTGMLTKPLLRDMLTAAEQAEPAPNTLVDTISDEVWGHDASKDNCLVVDRDGLSEPAPAARPGAVKVDELAQEIRRVDGSNSLGAGALAEALMPFLAALEPAEPATDVEPVATVYRKGNVTGQLVWTKVGERADLPDGTNLFTRPPESRQREALEWYAEQARLCRLIHSGGDAGRNALAKDGGAKARAALAQGADDERS